jgi:Fe-S cluster biogenesis protein NfuA
VMPGQQREFTKRSERVEELVHRLENSGDPATRAMARELMQAVIELHGVALEHIIRLIDKLPGADAVLASLAADPIVSGVLSLHSLHPVPIQTRIEAALDGARPYLKSHGGNVELISVADGKAHIRLQGACGSCSSSLQTMKQTIESAIYDVAPEVVAIIAESAPVHPQSDLVVLQAN